MSLENTEDLDGFEFQKFLNEHHDHNFDNDMMNSDNHNNLYATASLEGNDLRNDTNSNGGLSHNFKSQTTTVPFHSSLGTDFLNLFAKPGT